MSCEPPAGSALAESLQRGLLAESFSSFEFLGRGAFGDVVKAWHLDSQQWLALKVIPVTLKADQTVDDDCRVCCGRELFDRLCAIRCPHVLRYRRRWTELYDDVGAVLPFGVRVPKSSCMQSPAHSQQLVEIDSKHKHALESSTESPSASVALTWTSFSETSDDGFEWSPNADPAGVDMCEYFSMELVEEDFTKKTRDRFSAVLLVEMEYYEGVTLQDWLHDPSKRCGLAAGSDEGTMDLFTQLMMALHELHSEGIVHRDVKPENIIISPSGQLKIIDFGLSRLGSPDETHSWQVVFDEASRTAVGTPGYAPPEHCWIREAPLAMKKQVIEASSPRASGSASPSSDIFSAGIVFVELLMAAVRNGPAWGTAMERARALQALRGGYAIALPKELLKLPSHASWSRRLIVRMLSCDAHARPSATEVLQEIAAGTCSRDRRNPYMGTSHTSSAQLAQLATSPATTSRNPYVGFFHEPLAPTAQSRRDCGSGRECATRFNSEYLLPRQRS